MIARFFFLLFFLTGCSATTSSIMVGEARTPTNPANVKLYFEPPANYEVIALIESTSELELAFTEQGKTDAVIENLKLKAAELGANGIIITSTGDKTSIGSYNNYGGGTTVTSSTSKVMKGKAIFKKD